jgi:hypothetical protein
MKKQVLAVVVALVASVVLSERCFAQPHVLAANIPFAFQVGNKWLPAGKYEIESVPTGAGSYQVIRAANGDTQLRFFTIPVNVREASSQPQLVFHRYLNGYYLSQIRTGEGKSRQLYESKSEKQAARKSASIEFAIAVR